MSDPLSDAFRSNIECIRVSRSMGYYQLGKIVTPNDPTQCRTQMLRGNGLNLSTVWKWAERLDLDPLTLLTPCAVQRSRNVRHDEAA